MRVSRSAQLFFPISFRRTACHRHGGHPRARLAVLQKRRRLTSRRRSAAFSPALSIA